MSLERIFKALTNLGLSQTDARVYIHLATKGSAKAHKMIFFKLNFEKMDENTITCAPKRILQKKVYNLLFSLDSKNTACK